jgi:VanZ family protein
VEGRCRRVEVGKEIADVRERRSSVFRLPPSVFRLFLYYWLPLIAYSALIVFQSHYPAPESIPRLPYFDKLLHTGGYGLLGLLFCRAFRSGWPGASNRSLSRYAVLSTALFGLSDEIHQSFVVFRTADAWDVLADALGGAIGVGFYFMLLSVSGLRSVASKRLESD